MKDFLIIYLCVCGVGCYLVVALDVFIDMKHSKNVFSTILCFVFLLCPVLYLFVAIPSIIRFFKRRKNRKIVVKEVDANELTPENIEKLNKEIVEFLQSVKEEDEEDV